MTTTLPAIAKDLSLEEVVVTAQKREQNAQTVPVTVDTFSSTDVENTGALILEDMQDYIPGFQVGEDVHGGGITQSQLIVRGVEGSNISTGGDPSVATFYDEVYLPKAATTVAFSDMQQIEVLKGPQGTLFGRNAAAGVVNMIPNAPSEETEAMLSARLGNYGLGRYE
ncbi:TonB-dependent receptor plug domain-containing protein, partial [Zhongshania sp.]|uniref:TonB-dependent receptor plug domain-containing protein n=1 Tax=Zhongshania sp. TaxID=1971902 RepID=UPI00356AA98A